MTNFIEDCLEGKFDNKYLSYDIDETTVDDDAIQYELCILDEETDTIIEHYIYWNRKEIFRDLEQAVNDFEIEFNND